jgi:AhpD family alkylhydroperoxidase
MTEGMYPVATPEIAVRRRQLAPEVNEAFENFGRAVFADGALPQKVKQLIAVAVAHVTQCPYCITGHTRLAHRQGATPEEIMEAIWVAAEMRAGGAYAHSTLALHALVDGVAEPAAERSTSARRTGSRNTGPAREPTSPAPRCGPARRAWP